MLWAFSLACLGSLASAAVGPPPNATNSSTGVVTDKGALTRALPLKQLRLITPNKDSVSGTVSLSHSCRQPAWLAPGDWVALRYKTHMRAQDAVTLVFSRAVIALGSNFHGGGNAAVGGLQPLLWACSGKKELGTAPLPGRTWWVTTSIVRFDPASVWPNDLKCQVRANPALRAFDGTPIQTASIKPLKFASEELYVIAKDSGYNRSRGSRRSELCRPQAAVWRRDQLQDGGQGDRRCVGVDSRAREFGGVPLGLQGNDATSTAVTAHTVADAPRSGPNSDGTVILQPCGRVVPRSVSLRQAQRRRR